MAALAWIAAPLEPLRAPAASLRPVAPRSGLDCRTPSATSLGRAAVLAVAAGAAAAAARQGQRRRVLQRSCGSEAAPATTADSAGRRRYLRLTLVAAAGAATGAREPTAARADTVTKGKLTRALVLLSQLLKEDKSQGPGLVKLGAQASITYSKFVGAEFKKSVGAYKEELAKDPVVAKAMECLEPIKRRAPELSYADLYTLAGAVAVQYLGGQPVAWRAGRDDPTDQDDFSPLNLLRAGAPADRPDLSFDQPDVESLKTVFQDWGLKKDREIVPLRFVDILGQGLASDFSSTKFFKELYDSEACAGGSGEDCSGSGPREFTLKPADLLLMKDNLLKQCVKAYGNSPAAFCSDFSKAYAKQLEFGTNLIFGTTLLYEVV